MLFYCKLWVNCSWISRANSSAFCWNNEMKFHARIYFTFTQHVWTWRFIINSFHTINTEFYYLSISSRSSCVHHCVVPSDFFTISLVSKEQKLTCYHSSVRQAKRRSCFGISLQNIFINDDFEHIVISVRQAEDEDEAGIGDTLESEIKNIHNINRVRCVYSKFRQIMVLVLFSTVSVNSSVGVFSDWFFLSLQTFSVHTLIFVANNDAAPKQRWNNIAHRQVNHRLDCSHCFIRPVVPSSRRPVGAKTTISNMNVSYVVNENKKTKTKSCAMVVCQKENENTKETW